MKFKLFAFPRLFPTWNRGKLSRYSD